MEKTVVFSVYPNPVFDMLNIKCSENKIEDVKLLDFSGRELDVKARTNNSKMEIDVSDLEGGIYFLEMKTGNTTVVKKIYKFTGK